MWQVLSGILLTHLFDSLQDQGHYPSIEEKLNNTNGGGGDILRLVLRG